MRYTVAFSVIYLCYKSDLCYTRDCKNVQLSKSCICFYLNFFEDLFDLV